jgi:hypothetical protein
VPAIATAMSGSLPISVLLSVAANASGGNPDPAAPTPMTSLPEAATSGGSSAAAAASRAGTIRFCSGPRFSFGRRVAGRRHRRRALLLRRGAGGQAQRHRGNSNNPSGTHNELL